jgi:aryl-alcohol dehydrogenase-like predicted oxidoreductase
VRTHLPTRRLGSSDLRITRVGFGAWAIGGGDWSFGWGPQDDDDSVAAILRAVDLGINWIDTAAVYGLGHSEEVVAEAVRGLPDPPYIFTKCGALWDDHGRVSRVARPDTIRREVEASLRRLRVERIDLYQVHQIPFGHMPVEEYWQTMADPAVPRPTRSRGVPVTTPG